MTWTPVERRPVARETSPRIAQSTAGAFDWSWVQRYIELRRAGLVAPLLRSSADDSGWWVGIDPMDLWGSATFYTVAELRSLIEKTEGSIYDRSVNAA